MKKTNFLLSVILILTVSIAFTSCKDVTNKEESHTETSQEEVLPEKTLLGKWVLQDMEVKSNEEAKGMKEMFDAIKKELIGKVYYEFKADKTSTVYMPGMMGMKEKIDKGTWAISSDSKTIHTTGKEKIDLTIISLDQKKLVFSFGDEMGQQIMTLSKG